MDWKGQWRLERSRCRVNTTGEGLYTQQSKAGSHSLCSSQHEMTLQRRRLATLTRRQRAQKGCPRQWLPFLRKPFLLPLRTNKRPERSGLWTKVWSISPSGTGKPHRTHSIQGFQDLPQTYTTKPDIMHSLTRCSIYTRLLILHQTAYSLPSQQHRLWSCVTGFRSSPLLLVFLLRCWRPNPGLCPGWASALLWNISPA